MRLAISNIGFAPGDDETVYAEMSRCGFSGLEAAPTRLAARPCRAPAPGAKVAAALRARYGFFIPSMQSIWYGLQGNIFVPEDAARLARYTARIVDFAAAAGCPSLVFGCPRQRYIPRGMCADDALGFFARISAYARLHGVSIALEANPPVYGTNFCNVSSEAFAFARKVPGLAVNYDLGTLLTNGESLDTLFENLEQVSHIHLSEPELAPIRPRPVHRELARRLREAGYTGFVSVEMKTQPVETVRRVLEYTAEVFV